MGRGTSVHVLFLYKASNFSSIVIFHSGNLKTGRIVFGLGIKERIAVFGALLVDCNYCSLVG